MGKEKTIKTILEYSSAILNSSRTRKVLFGEYADGTPRSLPDCLDGEILSPKERKKYMHNNKKKGKKNKLKYK